MEQALTQPAVKILFGDSTSFNVMRWTFILPEKQKSLILYMTCIRISPEYLHYIGIFTKLSCLNVKLLFSMSLQALSSIF